MRTVALLLLAAALGAGAAGSRQEEAVDVVFVIDSSNSMANSDKEGLRSYFMRAAVDFLQGRGGDRVAVVQFAGWFETEKRKIVVMDLTEIPKPGSGDAFKTNFANALKEVEIFGQASDINVAFEKGLKQISDKRKGTKNPWWVVVVTDGDFDALEPGNVRPEYKDLADKHPDGANVDTINEAAGKIFTDTVRPNFVKESGSGLTMSGISLARDTGGNDRIKQIVGEGSKIGNLTATPVKDLLVPLLGTSPLLRKGKGGFYGYVSGQASVPIHVYEGAVNTRVIAFSRGGSLKATFKGGKADVLGEGPYQVLHLRDVPAGDYTVDIEGAKDTVEVVVWSDFAYTASAKMTSAAKLPVGQKMAIDLRVEAGGKPVTDKAFLQDLKAIVKVTGPNGEETHTVEFKGRKDATATFEQVIESPADYTAVVTFQAIPDSTTFQPFTFYAGPFPFKASGLQALAARFPKTEIWLGESAEIHVTPRPGPATDETRAAFKDVGVKGPDGKTQRLPVAFKGDHWEGKWTPDKSGDYEIVPEQAAGYQLVVEPTKLTVKARTFTATFSEKEVFERQPVTLIVQGEGLTTLDVTVKGLPKKVTATMNKDRNRLEAVVPTDAPAEYEIQPEAGKGFELKLGANPKVVIKKRTFSVVEEKDGKSAPVTEITIDAKWRETGKYTRELTAILDVGKGEVGQIVAEITNAAAKDATLTLVREGWSPSTPLQVSGIPPVRKMQLVLTVATDADLPADIGSVKFQGKVAGQTFPDHVIKVKLTFSDKAGKQFKKILPFLILGLILLLLLIWFLMLGRWKDHQLRYFTNNNLDTKNYHRDMNAGFMKRSAVGTPQLPSILNFKLSGMKTGTMPVTVMPIKISLTVQGKPATVPTLLKHGDEIVVESEKTLYRFIYFEKEPTADEIAAALSGLIAGDEIFLEE